MLIPYTTDCYRDSRPYGTIGLLLMNAVVFGALHAGVIDAAGWISNWSQFDWLEGLRSQFFHEDIDHLLGNLLGLWIFGQVVEGAIGTRAFLLWILAVALSSIGIEYLALSGREGRSYGASGIVFACIAGGALLAPKTRIHFAWWIHPPRTFDAGLVLTALFYLGLEIVQAAVEISVSTELVAGYTPLLHTTGFAIGAGLAYIGLKLRLVDAGGWDWLSRRAHESRGAKLGDFVAPDVAAPTNTSKSTQPTCEHCGRVRPARLMRCMYCGKV